jgi:hypothetical protein
MPAIVLVAAMIWWTAISADQLFGWQSGNALTVRTGEWRGDTICFGHELRCGGAAAAARNKMR